MKKLLSVAAIIFALSLASNVTAQSSTAFTYQGTLSENGNPGNNEYDFTFSLHDDELGGNQLTGLTTVEGVTVINGSFTVEVDFGSNVFDNSDRWLEILVDGTTLSPRQKINRTPYAIQTRGIFVNDDEEVGIGTTNPINPLHVEAPNSSGRGVFVNITETGAGLGDGIQATTDDPGGFAIFGQHLANGRAGQFIGNVDITGSLSKGAGSFKIDHPLDPKNKYLYHSFVESPDMMNIYNGNITTDDLGYATVEMPEWFEALNREFRYQLTVIDRANSDNFVLAKVVEGIETNRFKIRTSVAGAEVSWQVTGVRKDAFAQANRIPIEEDKPDFERGYYLHPGLFGFNRTRNMDAARKALQAETDKVQDQPLISTSTESTGELAK